MRITVLCPHFAPDVAPTGEVMTSIACELVAPRPRAARRHRAAVVPPARHRAGLGRPARAPRGHGLGPHHPRAPVPDRQDEHPGAGARVRRVHRRWRRSRRPSRRQRPDAGARHVAAADARRSPAGPWPARRRVPFVFNIQDVFPDVAVELGLLTGTPGDRGGVVRSSGSATAAPTPSPCCPTSSPTTCAAKLAGERGGRGATPAAEGARHPELRRHRADPARPTARTPTATSTASTGKRVVMYAGNVGLSQSLDLVLDAAVALRRRSPTSCS